MKIISPLKYRKIFFLFIFLIISSLASSCIQAKDPYYPAELIPQQIIKICQNEYNSAVKVNIFEDTLWLYIPLKRFVDQAGNADPEFTDTLNHIVLSISRVIMSTKSPPKFYVIVASDIKDIGADYFLMGYILDVKKYLFNFISREEFSRRQIISFALNSEALSDAEGKHIQFINLTLDSFILAQIKQRIISRFEQDNLLSKFKIEELQAIPEGSNIKFVLDIKSADGFKYDLDLTGLALKTIAYVFLAYDFKGFETITIVDSYSGKYNTYNRKSLEDFR